MDTKALRQKILDLAIRGKLVPQNPDDEPASVLLERIRAEKQQMVKDGKLKPKDIKDDTIIFKGDDNLHYEKFPDGTVKCIEDEIPFELPDGWEWTRIFSISFNLPYGTAKKSDSKGKVAVLRMGNLQNGEIDYTDLVYSSDDEDIKQYELLENDLLFNRTNSAEWVGKTAIYRGDVKAIYAGYLIRLRTGLNAEYLNAVMNSQYERDYCNTVKTDGVNQSNINAQKLGAFLIPVPSLSEQYRIVYKYNNLLSFIDTIESDKSELQTTIQLTKSKILDLAIRGQLIPQAPNDEPSSVLLERIRAEKEELIKQGKIKRDKKESFIFKGDDNSYYEKIGDTVTCIDEELPFELPDGWTWCRGASCFLPMESRKPSGTHFKYIDIDSIDNKYQAIKEAKITETAKAPSRASRAVFDGSILFSLVRPYLKNIALVDSNNADSIASTGFYIATSNGTFIPKYLYILMISAYVVDGLNQFMKGDNSPSISKDNIEKWLYPVPPLSEQEKMADTVQKYISILEDIEKSLS